MRRVAVIASASGSGKTTLGRAVAERLGVPFLELDALVHGRGWVETPNADLRAVVEPVVRSDGWVIDNPYERKLGEWPTALAAYPVVRLRSQAAVEAWLAGVG